jgi:AraC family transcriptional regulator
VTEWHRVRGGLAPWQLDRVALHIESRLAEPISVSELAALARLSVNHFGKAFHVSVGEPPTRYIRHRRVERAKWLLLCSQKSLSEIAGDCGFSDQPHMTRVFRALTGTSPARWRQMCRS